MDVLPEPLSLEMNYRCLRELTGFPSAPEEGPEREVQGAFSLRRGLTKFGGSGLRDLNVREGTWLMEVSVGKFRAKVNRGWPMAGRDQGRTCG